MASEINLRLVSDNRLHVATLTAASTAAGFPVRNLKDIRKSKYHRSVGTSQTYTLVFPANETINCVTIPKGNFSPTATFQLQMFSDTAGTTSIFDSGVLNVANPTPWSKTGGQFLPSGGDGFAYGGGCSATIWVETGGSPVFLTYGGNFLTYNGLNFLTSGTTSITSIPTNVRRLTLTITDSANTDGRLDVASLVVGNAYQTAYMPALGIAVGYTTSTVKSRNDAGDSIANLGYKFKQLTFDLTVMPETDRAYMFAMFRNNSTDLPIYVYPFYNTSVPQKAEDYSIFGCLSELSKIKMVACPKFATSLSLEEV
jgi:hypothetical protein